MLTGLNPMQMSGRDCPLQIAAAGGDGRLRARRDDFDRCATGEPIRPTMPRERLPQKFGLSGSAL